MPIYAGKNIPYAHFAEICEKCGNVRNMQQSHIGVKLRCAVMTYRSEMELNHIL